GAGGLSAGARVARPSREAVNVGSVRVLDRSPRVRARSNHRGSRASEPPTTGDAIAERSERNVAVYRRGTSVAATSEAGILRNVRGPDEPGCHLPRGFVERAGPVLAMTGGSRFETAPDGPRW